MNDMLIPLDGWAAPERTFRFHAGLEFFQGFDNQEILDADVDVEARVKKTGERKVQAVLHLQGSVTVPCTRCLEPVVIPVDSSPSEVLAPVGGEVDWDIAQPVYDYICLSLPLQRVHPEGGCNPDTVRYLRHEERTDEEAGTENSPFAALKGLLDSK